MLMKHSRQGHMRISRKSLVMDATVAANNSYDTARDMLDAAIDNNSTSFGPPDPKSYYSTGLQGVFDIPRLS